METRRKGTKITEKVFNVVKILLAGGASYEECAEYMGIGTTSVWKISSAETYEEYKSICAAMGAKYYKNKKAKENKSEQKTEPEPEVQAKPVQEAQPQVVEHRQSVTVQTTYYVNQKLDKIEEALKGISAKLACIIDDLYGTNSRKDA